ncbi:hypothetical protein LCGC14_2010800 [marine sediment metagenome]|uniref:Uncharacterized protein n=1 Tax=marine sediment metagenome TaxID=412755 RepID=A0A0F9FMX0_9ZZZZ
MFWRELKRETIANELYPPPDLGKFPGGKRGPQRKGPLRRVVKTLKESEGIFDRPVVLLECDHVTTSWGVKARCSECRKVVKGG